MGRKGIGWKQRNRNQIAQDQKQEAALRREGKSLRDIAEELGISYETVRKDLKLVDRGLMDEAKADLLALKAQVAGKLRAAQVEAFLAFKLSQEDAVTVVVKVTPDGTETTTTTKGQAGSQGLLSNFITAVDKEARLFDLYKPEKSSSIELNELEQLMAENLREARAEHGASQGLPVQPGTVPVSDPVDGEDQRQ